VEGGVPTRLTWHPGADQVQAFTTDGTAILFTSGRAVFTNRYTQLFKIPMAGGVEELVPIPNVADAVEGPGGRIAYNPIAGRYQQWKEYRGGTVSRIWIYDPAGRELEKIPQPPTRSNDADPMWPGGTVLPPDRNGEFNILRPANEVRKQVTIYSDFPILTPRRRRLSLNRRALHLFDPSTSKTTRLKIGVTADLPETRRDRDRRSVDSQCHSPPRPRRVRVSRRDRHSAGREGDPRNLTMTPNWHEWSPAWSPMERRSQFPDEGGEHALRIAGRDGKPGPHDQSDRKRFYDDLTWSPDGKKIYVRQLAEPYWLDSSPAPRRASTVTVYTPAGAGIRGHLIRSGSPTP
jgi:tricorn protease